MANNKFKLPKYLRLARGSMWFDTEGEDSSGIKLYSFDKVSVGRGKDGELVLHSDIMTEHYYEDTKLVWYCDTTKIDKNKQSKIILAYQYGILTKADPKNPPVAISPRQEKDFIINKKGDNVFIGKNKEIYKKLYNLDSIGIRDFIKHSPKTQAAKLNLMDMFDYEKKGYNPECRARGEIIDLIKAKLNEYGPGMSSIRVNEDDDED